MNELLSKQFNLPKGSFLRSERKRLKLRLKDISELLGVGSDTIMRTEREETAYPPLLFAYGILLDLYEKAAKSESITGLCENCIHKYVCRMHNASYHDTETNENYYYHNTMSCSYYRKESSDDSNRKTD